MIRLRDKTELDQFNLKRRLESKILCNSRLGKSRFDHVMKSITIANPAFVFTNNAEKLDYALVLLDELMAASGWFPGHETHDLFGQKKAAQAAELAEKEREEFNTRLKAQKAFDEKQNGVNQERPENPFN